MTAIDQLENTLLSARKLLVDLERHLDRAAEAHATSEVARAWVRAAQLERVLRESLPADATAEVRDTVEGSAFEGPQTRSGPPFHDRAT